MPSFSIIIPTRDRPDFISEAINSVVNQDFGDFELLVVNDGSDVVVPHKDSRLTILDNERRGAVAARNLGATKAKGKYIAFLDDDDLWTDQTHLARANSALGNTAAFYFANGIMLFPDGSTKKFSQGADAASLAVDNTILISAVCYHRSLHETLGLFDETLPYYWDWDWYLRVARAGHSLYHCDIAAAIIRVHANNMSGESNYQARRNNLDLLETKHRLDPITLKSHIDFV